MPPNSATKHRVFLSFYHEDEYYRKQFEELFEDIYVDIAVHPGDIDPDNSDEYIKRLIRKEYITNSSVVVVLVGPKTYCRKHVDWEIYAGLDIKAGGHSGLLGILLPTYPGHSSNEYDPETTPPRLLANVDSEYANIIRWTPKETVIQNWIEDAFKAREDRAYLIDNSLPQFKKNHCE